MNSYTFKSREDKEQFIHSTFSSIARRYDLLNSLLTFNRDHFWRAYAVRESGLSPGGYGLDVCCGTGEITLEMARAAGPTGKVVGIDFNEDMLAVAEGKKGYWRNQIQYVHGNAMALPFADATFDTAIIGLALRNVPDIRTTLREMKRVVKPGGTVVSLEMGKTSDTLPGRLSHWYFKTIVPVLGRLSVGDDNPYSYLVQSVERFIGPEKLKDIFYEVGLDKVRYHSLTMGVVAVHIGIKPQEG